MLARTRFLYLFLVLLLWGCPQDIEPNADSPPDYIAPGDVDNSRCTIRGDVDSDGDGLPDIFEDLNRNCLVDSGETDPFNPDSDGDGLLDGDEDADGNGVWDADRGELNPRTYDTDGNGIPDGEEPKAAICNRKHAIAALAERRVLGENATMYLHPKIAGAELFGFSGAVFLRGEGKNEAGIIFETQRYEGVLQDILAQLPPSLQPLDPKGRVELVGERDAVDYGQFIAHIRAESVSFSLPVLLDGLQEFSPALKDPMPLRESYTVDSTDLTFQLLGVYTGERVRWALAWKPIEGASTWFSVVHPRLVAENPSDTIRFVCENVESLKRPQLDILMAIDGSDASFLQATPWLAAVRYVVSERQAAGLGSRVFTLIQDATTGEWRWELADPQNFGVNEEEWTMAPSDRPLDTIVAEALQDLPSPSDGRFRELAVLVLSGTGEQAAASTENDTLPELSRELGAASFVVVSPTREPFDCAWRMSAQRAESVQRLVRWSEAFHLGGCGVEPTADAASRILAPMIGWAWLGTRRDVIWGTLYLADGTGSVPADVTVIGGFRALVAPLASRAENSAVSFAAWFPVSSVE